MPAGSCEAHQPGSLVPHLRQPPPVKAHAALAPQQGYEPVVKLLTAFVVVFGSLAAQFCVAGGAYLLIHGTRAAGCTGGRAAAPAVCGVGLGLALGLLIFCFEVGCFFCIHFMHEVALPAAKAKGLRFVRRQVAGTAAAGGAAGGGGGGDASVASSSSNAASVAGEV